MLDELCVNAARFKMFDNVALIVFLLSMYCLVEQFFVSILVSSHNQAISLNDIFVILHDWSLK